MKQISTRLTEADFERLRAAADAEHRSIANYTALVLVAHLDEKDDE